MTSTAEIGRFPIVEGEHAGPGAALRARRKSLGLTGVALAKLAEVNREHLSAVERERKQPTDEWLRRVELAMDRYEHETGQDEPEAEPEPRDAPELIEFEVSGDFGVRVVVKGPIQSASELEASVARLVREMRSQSTPKD